MKDKVTKKAIKYPAGESPDFMCPSEYASFRYAIGRIGNNPLVTICMNPSAAREETSDRTINRVIGIGQKLGYDGWVVFNTYPERATDASNMDNYNESLLDDNINVIRDFIKDNNITEIYGAWGDLKYEALKNGKKKILSLLDELDVKVFYFGTLTKLGNPRHPIQRHEKWDIYKTNKNYI